MTLDEALSTAIGRWWSNHSLQKLRDSPPKMQLVSWKDPEAREHLARTTPQWFEYFGADGKPNRAFERAYRAKRLDDRSYLDADGNMIFHNTSWWNESPTMLHAMRDRIIPLDIMSGVGVMSRNILRKVDPYYKEYVDAANKLPLQVISPLQRNTFGNYMTLRGLKNTAKSSNPEAAIKEIAAKFEELRNILHRERFNDLQFNSKNEVIDGTSELYNELVEYTKKPYEIDREVKPIFQYNDTINNAVQGTGWRLPYNKDDLLKWGERASNCLMAGACQDDISTGKSLVLIKPPYSVEVALPRDEQDLVKDITLKQFEGPGNLAKFRGTKHTDEELPKILERLQALRGTRYVGVPDYEDTGLDDMRHFFEGLEEDVDDDDIDSDVNLKRFDTIVSDVLAKYTQRPQERNIIRILATDYKGMPEIQEQAAVLEGVDPSKVLDTKTDTGKVSNHFGLANDPNKTLQNLAKRIAAMRY